MLLIGLVAQGRGYGWAGAEGSGNRQLPGRGWEAPNTRRSWNSTESHAFPRYSTKCRFRVLDNEHASSRVTSDTNILETKAPGGAAPERSSSHAFVLL